MDGPSGWLPRHATNFDRRPRSDETDRRCRREEDRCPRVLFAIGQIVLSPSLSSFVRTSYVSAFASWSSSSTMMEDALKAARTLDEVQCHLHRRSRGLARTLG